MRLFTGNIRNRLQVIKQHISKFNTEEKPSVGNRDKASENKNELHKSEDQATTSSKHSLHPFSQQHLKITQYPICMGLLFILTLEAVLIAITESFVILYHSNVFAQCEFSLNTLGLAQADLIYHGIFIISPIYQLFLYLDALRQRNVFQLFTVLLFGILMVIFSGIQTIQHMIFEQAGCDLSFHQNGNTTTFPNATIANSSKIQVLAIIYNTTHTPSFQDSVDASISNIRPFEYSTLAIVAISFVILLGATIKLYNLFTWKNYALHIFSDIQLRNAIISWSILSGLLKISFFYAFVYAMQLVPAVLIGYTNVPGFECIIVFAITLVAFLLAIHSIRHEEVKTLILFDLIILGSIGYFGYRLFTFGLPRNVTSDPFLLTRYNLLFTTLALTLLMILTLCASLVCFKNVVINNIKILDNYPCICPTCYMHENNLSSDTLSIAASFTSALSHTSDRRKSIDTNNK